MRATMIFFVSVFICAGHSIKNEGFNVLEGVLFISRLSKLVEC